MNGFCNKDSNVNILCPICESKTTLIGVQNGTLDNREFNLFHCRSCKFSFVENFRDDFHKIYDEHYYNGKGADRMVDYVHELNFPKKTIREYEWQGIWDIFQKLIPAGRHWLDYGCGGGGMVRYARMRGADAIGFEEGWLASKGRSMGIPILDSAELNKYEGYFDFISAIEVVEHIPQPMMEIQRMRKLLKRGGVLFLTTGNAKPWQSRLLEWGYTKTPDIHVAFYQPETLSKCFSMAGFSSNKLGLQDGLVKVIKYKVLKNLRVKNKNPLFEVLPWKMIAKLVDWHHQVSDIPYGVAIERN